MPSQGVTDRVDACAPTLWAAFAYSEFAAEALRRLFPELEAKFHELLAKRSDEPAGDEPASNRRRVSVSALMRGSGARLEAARDRMVAADKARKDQRGTLEEERRRRDELAKTLYRHVVWARDMFEKRAGRRRTTSYLAVTGETPRDPHELLKVAGLVADQIADPEAILAPPGPGVQVREEEVAKELRSKRKALKTSIKTIKGLESEEKGLISLREQQVAAFDELHGVVARFLETLLELAEMPTLAAAVRPQLKGTGRRGRPSKKRPRDLFPDLVTAALALDPDAGLTIQQIRDLVPRRPVEYRRLEDVPSRREIAKALASEAEAFRGQDRRSSASDRMDTEALGGPAAVEGLKSWLAGIGRSVLGRKE